MEEEKKEVLTDKSKETLKSLRNTLDKFEKEADNHAISAFEKTLMVGAMSLMFSMFKESTNGDDDKDKNKNSKKEEK